MRRNKVFKWCIKKGLLKKIKPDFESAEEHIFKARHNLRAADFNLKGSFEDWVVSQLYYAVYHAFTAILYSKGYKSKSHECTIQAIEYLIYREEISLDIEDIMFVRTTEQMTLKDAKSLREEFQYGTKTKINKEILKNLIKKSKKIVEKSEVILNE